MMASSQLDSVDRSRLHLRTCACCAPRRYNFHVIETAGRGVGCFPAVTRSNTFPSHVTEQLTRSLMSTWTDDMLARGYKPSVRRVVEIASALVPSEAGPRA